MKQRIRHLLPTLLIGLLLLGLSSDLASGQITSAQRREIRAISSTLGQVRAALRKDDRDAAQAKLEEAEKAFAVLREETGLEETDSAFTSLVKLFKDRRADLGVGGSAEPAMNGKQPVNSGAVDPRASQNVSFVRDVVPILTGKCVRCHSGNRARGGLDISTFAAMKAGGDGGPLLVRGQPAQSQLIERVVTDDFDIRMPQGGQLFDDEIAVLTKWVADGAQFDGDSESTPLRGLARSKTPAKDIVIPKPKGTETVSFSKDVGPMFNRICLSCHQGNNPSGGLSLMSFNDLMAGGDSGPVIIPGDAENSRLFRLVGGLELPRMPGDQSRIRRSEYAALKTWFEEGNVFDGPDPAANILSYIETPERIAARERDARSAAEWAEARDASTKSLWKRAMPIIDPTFAKSGNVYAAGNVDNLSELAAVADAHWSELAATLGPLDGVEKGLSLLVVDSGYAQKEIGRSLASTQVSGTQHAFASPDQETRYAAVDVSNPSETTLSAEDRIRIAVTSAYVASFGGGVPRWLSEGAGRALVITADRTPIAVQWRNQAGRAVAAVSPADVFNDTSYEPDQVAEVGYALVDGLIDNGGKKRLGDLAKVAGGGEEIKRAIQRVYRQPAAAIGAVLKRGG